MTDSQPLLVEYAKTGSESAFRELVTRYVGLVYSTALRLVDRDTHLAEDVVQTVFTDLARKARSLPRGVMLGGWLHQRTFNVAAPMMRAARRRQAREREAAPMNAMQDNPAADLEQIAPMLDEVLTKLAKDDRTAIILRFFERRDFRSIGVALGSNENAARMRVNRTLEKLHILLKHRGAALSAAALGAALSAEAASAAPAGLATSVAGAALAGSAAAGGTIATLLKLGIMTKLKAGVIGAIIIAGITASLVIQQQAQARMREQHQALRQQSDQLAQLSADNERLSTLVRQANGSKDQLADLVKLRAETESLGKQTNDLSALQAENRRLQQRSDSKPKTPLQITEEMMARSRAERNWLLAFRLYAMDHQGKSPTSFEQAKPHLPPDPDGKANVPSDQLEIVYSGPYDLPNGDPLPNGSEIIVLREREPWQYGSGTRARTYGMANGVAQTVSMPSTWTVGGKEIHYDTFEAFEKDHIITAPGK